jgi:hypothetical protein
MVARLWTTWRYRVVLVAAGYVLLSDLEEYAQTQAASLPTTARQT